MNRKLTLIFPFASALLVALLFFINFPQEISRSPETRFRQQDSRQEILQTARENSARQLRMMRLRGGFNLILICPVLGLLFYLVHALEDARKRENLARNLAQKTVRDYDSRIHAVALDLHDDIAQTMFIALTSLETAPETSTRLIRESLHKLRALSRRLRPGEAVSLPLGLALEKLTHEYAASAPFQIQYSCQGTGGITLPPEMQIQIYRIVQESLTNAVKHSGADRVQVTVLGSYPLLAIRIADNGIGMPRRLPETGRISHLGIQSLRERAELLRGKLRIQSVGGKGTTVSLTIPAEQYWHDDS